jgi:hypothetical protein
VAASPQRSQRQRQSGANEDSSVEGASGLGSGGMGVLPVERALGSGAACRSRDRREKNSTGATGSVSDHDLRLAYGKKTPTAGHAQP